MKEEKVEKDGKKLDIELMENYASIANRSSVYDNSGEPVVETIQDFEFDLDDTVRNLQLNPL